MARAKDPMWARDHESGQHLKFAAAADFSRKLRRLMIERQITQSDLARTLWGDAPTPSGNMAARNRDRISKYCSGKTVPDPTTLMRLADALGCRPEELAPSLVIAEHEDSHPEMRMTLIAGRRDHVHVTLNTVMPLADFLAIAAIVEQSKTRAPTSQERDQQADPDPGQDLLRSTVLTRLGEKIDGNDDGDGQTPKTTRSRRKARATAP